MDHFTWWQDVIPIPDATTPVVAATLDQQVFCYLGLPKQLHSDQGAQFESQLMEELCILWRIDKTHTTPLSLSVKWCSGATKTWETHCGRCY